MCGYDYSQPGMYYMTSCVKDRECLFGESSDGAMQLNDYGFTLFRPLPSAESLGGLSRRKRRICLVNKAYFKHHAHEMGMATSPIGEVTEAVKPKGEVGENQTVTDSPFHGKPFFIMELKSKKPRKLEEEYFLVK